MNHLHTLSSPAWVEYIWTHGGMACLRMHKHWHMGLVEPSSSSVPLARGVAHIWKRSNTCCTVTGCKVAFNWSACLH